MTVNIAHLSQNFELHVFMNGGDQILFLTTIHQHKHNYTGIFAVHLLVTKTCNNDHLYTILLHVLSFFHIKLCRRTLTHCMYNGIYSVETERITVYIEDLT